MILISYRVENFRSISDSNKIELASDMTILAGKNEAGKTTILQALNRFNEDNNFDTADLPIPSRGKEATPKISIEVKLTPKDVQDLVVLWEVNLPDAALKAYSDIPIGVVKTYDNKRSLVELAKGSILSLINSDYDECDKDYRKAFMNLKKEALKSKLTVNEFKGKAITHERAYESVISQTQTAISGRPQMDTESIQQMLKEYKIISEKLLEIASIKDKRTQDVTNKLPKFVFFSSFSEEELLPYEIELTEAKMNNAVMNFFRIAHIDLDDLINNTDTQYRMITLQSKSAELDGDFGEYWEQDKLTLSAKPNGDSIVFSIGESESPHIDFKVEQRSKGLQWFLAFYLLLKVESLAEPRIILIDEPGLYVHASAQESILRVLKAVSRDRQIMYSTHSPYLIDPKRLDRIRLVIKNLERKENKKTHKLSGTTVHELSDVMVGERDTLTPIITAIGLDITKQLTFAADDNLILEGMSDYNYISGVLELLPQTKRDAFNSVHMIPSKGADNIPNIVSLMIGWRLNYMVLLDNDDKGISVSKTLTEDLSVSNNQTFVSDGGGCIEDLFSIEDFDKYFLSKSLKRKLNQTNSEAIPDKQKIILSQKFLNDCRNNKVVLSEVSLTNFNRVIDKVLGNFQISV